jgi:hypothetical protein
MKKNFENLISEKNQHWMDILVGDRNIDAKYLEEIFPEVDYNLGLALSATRAKILKDRTPEDIENLTFDFTIESIEKTFLEPISKTALECIKSVMQENNWSLKQAYQECKQFGCNIFLVTGTFPRWRTRINH